jgi:hypothetical protein
MPNKSVAEDLDNAAKEWADLQHLAKCQKLDQDLEVLELMGHAGLAMLAHRALEACAAASKTFGYELHLIEDHFRSKVADVSCHWILSQAGKDGGFNKMTKSLGGSGLSEWPCGAVLTYETWEAANIARSALSDEIRPMFYIYPVVIAAGREPRTTDPES